MESWLWLLLGHESTLLLLLRLESSALRWGMKPTRWGSLLLLLETSTLRLTPHLRLESSLLWLLETALRLGCEPTLLRWRCKATALLRLEAPRWLLLLLESTLLRLETT